MKRVYRFIIFTFFSFSLAIALYFFPHRLMAQTPDTISSIQKGIELYQTEQYEAALQVWQNTLAKSEPLSKSLIHSNIALAWQELGNIEQAEKAIIKSLEIIDNISEETETSKEIKAKILNTKASVQWSKGNFAEAVNLWGLAAKQYLEVADKANYIKCQLNQAKALQAAGLTNKAKIKLEQIHQELITDNSPLQTIGLQYLGNVLRKVGDLKSSETVLQDLDLADPNTLLELANTQRALSNSYLATNQSELADKYANIAIFNYQKAFNLGNLEAGLNQLSFAIALGEWSNVESLIIPINLSLDSLPFNRSGIYARLNFIRNVSCLKQIQENDNLACVDRVRHHSLQQKLTTQKPSIKTPDWQHFIEDIETIISNTADSQTLSYATGELGRIYELQEKLPLAYNYTQQALLTLEEINAPEISYRWQWQLGRILQQQDKISDAILAYSTAINNLKSIRSDLLIVNSEAQFSFRDNIEPIYREFVGLLLAEERKVTQEDLELAIQSIDTLQLTEVENFLNCELNSISQIQLTTANLDRLDDSAGFIYPIILRDRIEVIFKLPGQPIRHHTNLVPQTTVEQTINKLKKAILRGYPEQTIALSTVVYDWLIAPIETYLENNEEITTLVFVLDGELRNIPMGVLYDSQQQEYLIEKPYAIALLPSFQAFDLQNQSTELKVLGGGINQQLQVENKSFVGLNVTEELTNIENILSGSILLNEQFTPANIKQNLREENFSVVHLATHGNFSSNPEETYLVVYDSNDSQGTLLKARELDELLTQNQMQQPIDLLVLSACETAEGDNRATLGLAGLAIKAGTRSTLATLWQVNDESTVKLMTRFYQELNTPGITKAMALHRAQQSLLNDLNFQAPFYWSTYVLVGNWQ